MTTDDIGKVLQMIEVGKGLNKKEITEAICWMILGDGSIEKKERGNYCLSISHSAPHEDYLWWKGSIIETFTSFSIKPQRRNRETLQEGFKGSGDMVRLRSSAHPWFTKMYERIYAPLGRKSIDPHALKLLGPLGLAILYQDDGSYHYSSKAGHNILLHKLCFSEFELLALSKHLVDKFGILFRLNRVDKGLGFRLRLRAKDREKFFDLIGSYIVPSMSYKVSNGDTLKSGEIVWSA